MTRFPHLGTPSHMEPGPEENVLKLLRTRWTFGPLTTEKENLAREVSRLMNALAQGDESAREKISSTMRELAQHHVETGDVCFLTTMQLIHDAYNFHAEVVDVLQESESN